MPVRAVDDKPSDTLVVVSGEGFWTGSSTLPHLHQHSVSSSGGHVASALRHTALTVGARTSRPRTSPYTTWAATMTAGRPRSSLPGGGRIPSAGIQPT